ncbi:MAG: hypothetical protein K2Q28_06590 [Hyphomicrobium sp.]|nr:hypothetical protein [Hyphomicrobium sp.]
MKCSASVAFVLMVVAASTAKAADCKPFGGVGNGVTEGIAKFMAEAAVKNVIENKGSKPTGEIKHSCKSAMLGSECSARQMGCK